MNRPVLITLFGAVVVAAALALAFFSWEGERDAPPPPQQAEDRAPAPAMNDSTETAEPEGPTFDVVRIDPEGNTVVAGKADPNSTVVILDDGKEVGRATADSRGEWVFLPDEPLAPGSRELSLRSVNPDGKEESSEDVVVLVVPERPEERALALKTDREGGGSRLLQGAAPLAESGALSVDTVDYDSAGRLTIGGRAKPDAPVQLYLDNAFLGRTVTRDEGRWELTPETRASEGKHMLRADMLSPDGKVEARVEVPFERVLTAMPDGIRVVVQPGNSLWLLARKAYGEGTAYTVIYDANRRQIRNPDLIYPGQVFIMPTPPASQ